MLRDQTRIVYYTSAATAMQILRNREIWMRNTQVMNDFLEVDHGISCVQRALATEAGRSFQSLANTFYPNAFAEAHSQFEAWIPGLRGDTFLTCVSEHPATDDQHGRLSMWRAYGGNAGVALVLNPAVFFRPSNALAAYSMPVIYASEEGLVAELAQVTQRLLASPEVVGGLGYAGFKNTLFEMLRFGAVCTKHPAFSEEREWRVISSPALKTSPLLVHATETIGNVPQVVLKLPLKDKADEGLFGIEPKDFIERILIGPCEHPYVLRRALWAALEEAGVSDPGPRLTVTGIPLRANQR